jgi:hypothetical protein
MLVPVSHHRTIIMLQKISFALVANPRASYSHFIDNSGNCVAVETLDNIEEAKVGVFTDFGPLATEGYSFRAFSSSPRWQR